jgi:hypothetical protein
VLDPERDFGRPAADLETDRSDDDPAGTGPWDRPEVQPVDDGYGYTVDAYGRPL